MAGQGLGVCFNRHTDTLNGSESVIASPDLHVSFVMYRTEMDEVGFTLWSILTWHALYVI